ncbi:unnamed protein product [Arctia plantaginis]|uniref:Adenylate cyclase N-terminal domain-containing protein n=1 Tax=Arctia plantaginis TaxID=874455 RepID=A0A8S0Z2G4_ARCPL|nr:unnamed protein product [Arctia plantaginis]
MLYQRYFLRMNQTNMTHLLGLLLGVSVGLMFIQLRTMILSPHFFNNFFSPDNVSLTDYDPRISNSTSEPFMDYVNKTHSSNDLDDLNTSMLRRDEYREKGRIAQIINGVILGITALVYGCLLACLSRPAMNEIYLLTISYIVFVTFLLIELALASTAVLRSVSLSAGVCALFTYATYATLPLRLHEATIGGLVLAAVNIGAHIILEDTTDMEILCTIGTLIACNVSGIMTHHPRELAQRRAFLETRDCVEARLVTQRENQQQERLLLSVLPRHVAMEMKADIASQPRQEQFHKIYIQRYENVR